MILLHNFEFRILTAVLLIVFWLAANPAASDPMDRSAERAGAKAAREQHTDEIDRWAPSLAIFGGFQEQNAQGTVDPSMLEPTAPQCVQAPPDCEIDRRIQPFDEGEDVLRLFRAGLSAELMSPRFATGFGNPRLFVHVDPILTVAFERSIAGTGNPGPLVEPDYPPAVTRSDPRAFSGQGSRILADVDSFVLNAGLGVAFTLDIFDRRIRIKPSVEYHRERLEVTGRVSRVVQVAQASRPRTPADFRLIELQDSDRQVYHAVGPGLEIETDASGWGPFVLVPFVAARAYHFFGNLDIGLRASNEFGESASWDFSRDRWQWAAHFGIRLRWVPE